MSKFAAKKASLVMTEERRIAIEELRGIINKEALMKGDIEVGIDEAGRGPVFGPMVYAGAAWPISSRSTLKKVGFADSKQLTEEDREELFALIQEFDQKIMHQKAIVCTPLSITYSQLAWTKESLNTYSHNCAKAIIRHFLSQGLRVTKAYLDTVGDPDKYRKLLEEEFAGTNPKIEFTVESKADDTFPVVSAASIVAKVTRDHAITDTVIREKIEVSREFGSGYPGDPNTIAWLNNHFDSFFGYPTVVRFSWSTITKRLEDADIKYGFVRDCHAYQGTLVNSFNSEKDSNKGKIAKRLNRVTDFQL
jgi:ribonuclease H2 subunit A